MMDNMQKEKDDVVKTTAAEDKKTLNNEKLEKVVGGNMNLNHAIISGLIEKPEQ